MSCTICMGRHECCLTLIGIVIHAKTCLQILEAQQRIAAGEQFATVAGQMSEDKARQGGDLGWKRRQEVVGAFADAAFKLEASVETSQFGLIAVQKRFKAL